MPMLKWAGKDKVVNHHNDVPFRVLERKWAFGDGASTNGENMVIHGDNLAALKALLPQYEGRVKCIYIDPPYNTGNEGWVYNDNVNDPQIKKWLGEVVGKEGEDFSRHDKWLCMMYPRLRLLQKLLADDGIIFISIDDVESAHLRLICDEIFGSNNFLANIAWEKRYTRSNNAKLFYSLKDSILCYRKSPALSTIKEARTAKADSNYANPDNDPRGDWMTASYVNPATKDKRPNLVYPITSPDGRIVTHPTHAWKYSREEHERHCREGRLWWGNDGGAKFPRLKLYKSEMPGMVPVDLWSYKETGTTDDGGNTLKEIFGSMVFDTPKPVSLIERMVKMVPDKNAIVLDSFAGSGTTAHAVLKMNKEDGGNRKFILIEMMDYADTVTAERVKRVISGYGEGDKAVEGTGGGFGYYELGDPLMIGENLNEELPLEKIREYVWYMETRGMGSVANVEVLPIANANSQSDNGNIGNIGNTKNDPYLLGIADGAAYYFCYEKGSTVKLNRALLRKLKTKAERYVVYADICLLDESELEKYNITFKKIPRDIARL
ncbi:MAG: site-specific DNA-methyltransferase [Kiritimatiellae bacterium]|nr:site-specific DNA-methyltransferase [Kiritimatiellia bacterium]